VRELLRKRFGVRIGWKSRVGVADSFEWPPPCFRRATKEIVMPEKKTIERARKAKREGKAPTTQAGEFVREEIEHIREGKHGAASSKQAIAIGLSKARRAGVKLPPPPQKAEKTSAPGRRKQAKRTTAKAKASPGRRKSTKRSRATSQALKRAPRSAASSRALSRQGRQAARRRKRSTGARGSTKRAPAR
jgi:hypothetical protein